MFFSRQLAGLAAVAGLVALVISPSRADASSLEPTARSSYSVELLTKTTAYQVPGGGRAVLRLPALNRSGDQATRLLVLGTVADASGRPWYRVLLPKRPNASSGWINGDTVRLVRNGYRINVNRASRTLSVTRAGRLVRSFRVVVGANSTPTPAGTFAVSEMVDTGRPNQFVGRWVLPLTAYSNVLQEFAGGPGQIALHGRGGASLSDPLGSAASHGCVRISNQDIAWLAGRVTPGTPVVIS